MCFVEIRHIWRYDESGVAMDLLLVHVSLRGEFKQQKGGGGKLKHTKKVQ